MWSWIVQLARGVAILVCFCAAPALAQDDQQTTTQQDAKPQTRYWDCISPLCTYAAPSKSSKSQAPQPYGGGTPLDVILSTRLWSDVPEAKDFVKSTRPPEETLQFQPTAGKDVARPKPRTPTELKAMEEELEQAGAAADRAAGVKSNFHVEAKKTKLSVRTKPMELSPLALRHEHSQN